jgi:hypothetical protein
LKTTLTPKFRTTHAWFAVELVSAKGTIPNALPLVKTSEWNPTAAPSLPNRIPTSMPPTAVPPKSTQHIHICGSPLRLLPRWLQPPWLRPLLPIYMTLPSCSLHSRLFCQRENHHQRRCLTENATISSTDKTLESCGKRSRIPGNPIE